MNAKEYVRSTEYESFIRIARNCDRGDKFGAHNQYMLNLIYNEKGINIYNNSNHYKLISVVKKHMTSATKFALKRKLDKVDKELLKSYTARIEQSSTADELLSICTEGIELLLKYKPSWDSI